MKCSRCGMTDGRAIVLALLQDAGAKCCPDALTCDGKHEHDFRFEPGENPWPNVVQEG